MKAKLATKKNGLTGRGTMARGWQRQGYGGPLAKLINEPISLLSIFLQMSVPFEPFAHVHFDLLIDHPAEF